MLEDFTLTLPGATSDEEIAILQRSAGEHPFVAWHGITAVNRFWFWDALWPCGAVYLAGLPGHGPVAQRPLDHYMRWTPQHFIETGISTLHRLAGGRPATLIGHSTGGMIALGIAQAAPELVARLVLLAPVVWGDLDGIVRLWQRFADRPQQLERAVGLSLGPGRASHLVFLASLNAFIAYRRGFFSNPKVFYAIRSGQADMRRTPLRGIAGTTHVLRQADMCPIVERAPASVPTLILHGERDPIVPIAQSRWLAGALPNAQLRAVPKLGHLLYAEDEPAINQIVLDWLSAHPLAHG